MANDSQEHPSAVTHNTLRQDVIADIDGAIAARAAALSVDGVTLSSLAFGGASVLWFMVTSHASATTLTASAFRIYLLAWCSLEYVTAIWRSLASSGAHGSTSDARIFAAWSFKLRNGPRIVADAIHGIVLAAAVFIVLPVPIWSKTALSVSLLSGVLPLLAMHMPIRGGSWMVVRPRSVELRRKGRRAIAALAMAVVAVGLGALVALAHTIAVCWPSFTWVDARTSMAILAIVIVTRQMCDRYGEQLLVQRLVTIRNDVVFGRVPTEEAHAQARHLVVGGNLNDLVATEVGAIAAAAKSMNALLPIMQKFADVLADEMRKSPDGTVPRSNLRDRMGTDLQALPTLSGTIAANMERTRKSMDSLYWKAYIAEAVFGEGASFLRALTQEIEAQTSGFASKLSSLDSARANLCLALEEVEQRKTQDQS